MHLNLFLRPFGNHQAAWRHPDVDVHRELHRESLIAQARIAEQGLFDSVFIADSPGVGGNPWNYLLGHLEPLTLLSAVAARTERIGLIGTVSTSYSEPYNVARQLASLDYLSDGRAGWNIVTTASQAAARNFGLTGRPDHSDRYARAAEHTEAVLALWRSWSPEAIVADKESGILVDTSLIREIGHEGEHFRIAGPIDVPPSPQGHPVLVQAGSSPDGKAFAARFAEAVFTAQETPESSLAFARDLRARAAAAGRGDETIAVLPGLSPLLASTEAEARRISAELHDLNIADNPLHVLSELSGIDLVGRPLDAPFPADRLVPVEEFQGHASRYGQIVELVNSGQVRTVGDLVAWHEGGRGHRVFIGTPEALAADLIAWVEIGAADGFNIMPTRVPDDLQVLVDEVVPLLQRAGHYRTEYRTHTLREHITERIAPQAEASTAASTSSR